MWDYIMGFNAWDNFALCKLAVPYEPSIGDMEYGRLLQQQWFNLTMVGSVPGTYSKPLMILL